MTKYLLFLLVLLHVKSFSQTAIANPFSATENNLKSPQVHLLKEFVDHPVDLSRGLAEITIPIYDIKFSDRTIPVKLMFHSSGLKADVAECGMLGLKWALNAGGFISREVRGYPDEHRSHKQGIIDPSFGADWITLYGGTTYNKDPSKRNPIFESYNLGSYFGAAYNGVYGKYEDTEYDIFTFSLPNGEGGKFILKDNNGNKTASFMPYKSYKINYLIEYGDRFTKFEIIDDQGYTYSFGKNDLNIPYYEEAPDQDYFNCWLLTSITSPNRKDIIKFDYIARSVLAKSPLIPVIINDNLEDFDNYQVEGCAGGGNTSAIFNALESTLYDPAGYFVKNYNESPYNNENTHYLTKITYNDVSIDFVYDTNAAAINNILLKKIEITKDNKIIKKVGFNVPSGGTSFLEPRTSYLKSIDIMGSTDEVIEKYSFDYYHLDKFPAEDKLCNSADYWGYYNSEVENVILQDTVDIYWMPNCGTHEQLLKKEIGSGNNRYSSPEDMKIGMIKSITYPTGGTTFFEYEGNKYGINANTGGLRIKNIIDKDKNGNDLKKREFTYGQNEDGIGEIPNYLKPDPSIRNFFEETETQYYIHDDAGLGPGYPESEPDVGTFTTRHITGYFPGSYYTFLYNLVSYDKVTEYVGDSSHNIGKIENYYSTNIPSLNDYYLFDNRDFSFKNNKMIIDPSNFWNGNHLSKKIEYKTENGLYSKVKQTDYLYNAEIVDEIYDLSIFRFKNFVGYATSTGQHDIKTALEELQQLSYNPRDYFDYKVQKYTIGVENLIETIFQ